MNVSPDVNFEELGRSTDDFNAAQLKAVCVEAGMLALRRCVGYSKTTAKACLCVFVCVCCNNARLLHLWVPFNFACSLWYFVLRQLLFSL